MVFLLWRALAFAGLPECLIELGYFCGMNPKKAFEEAKPAALKAVSLDEGCAEGHAALGLLRLLDDWDWQSADEETLRAIELAPGNPYVYWKRGVFLRYAGRNDESISVHLRAEQLDPLSIVAILEVGFAFYYARRFGEASAQMPRQDAITLARAPTRTTTATVSATKPNNRRYSIMAFSPYFPPRVTRVATIR